MKHGLLPSLLLTALLTTSAPVFAQPTDQSAALVERIAELKKRAVAGVEARAKLAQEMNDSIFSFGELAFQEFETSKYITDILEKNGFSVRAGVAGMPTAWVASWGSGGPVIALGSDIDCIPKASQKPGVAYREPMIEGAPGHGEGHNSGQAVNIVAALALKELMEQREDPRHADALARRRRGAARRARPTWCATACSRTSTPCSSPMSATISRPPGASPRGTGMVSVEYTFRASRRTPPSAPWRGRSALDAVELMNIGWNLRREHLRPEQRSHYVITDGGDQPNVVPSVASVWYFFREQDFENITQELRDRQHHRRSRGDDDRHHGHAQGDRHGGAAPLQQADRRGRTPTSSRSGCRNGPRTSRPSPRRCSARSRTRRKGSPSS